MADPIEKQYNQYLGRWVKVSSSNGTRVGTLKTVNYDWIELKPSLIDESITSRRKDITYRLEDKLPTTIKSGIVGIIEPLSEQTIKKILKRFPFKEE